MDSLLEDEFYNRKNYTIHTPVNKLRGLIFWWDRIGQL